MAPPATPNANGSGAPTGCFKCGRPGHWSRDCPSSSSVSSPSFAAGPSSNLPSSQQQKQPSSSGNWKSSAPSSAWKSGKPPLKPAPAKPTLPRKRPKLTPELLLSNDGLGYALEHLPRMVKIQGPGHEVDDLKSFLEAYVHWHSRILPYFSFNQFVEKVAKLGATKRVRMCVNDLRNKVARGDDLKLTREENNPECAEADKNPSLDNDTPEDGEPWEKAHDEAFPAEVNEDVFDEFYKQAVEEPSDAIPQTIFPNVSLPPEPASNDSAPSSAQSAPSGISEEQKLRMEANRLKALERAKARLAAPIAA